MAVQSPNQTIPLALVKLWHPRRTVNSRVRIDCRRNASYPVVPVAVEFNPMSVPQSFASADTPCGNFAFGQRDRNKPSAVGGSLSQFLDCEDDFLIHVGLRSPAICLRE